jgi:hypothetical protein
VAIAKLSFVHLSLNFPLSDFFQKGKVFLRKKTKKEKLFCSENMIEKNEKREKSNLTEQVSFLEQHYQQWCALRLMR